MSASVRRISMVAVLAAIVFGAAPGAQAYFPLGGFDEFGVLRYVRWPIGEFDTNNDGRIDAGEGLEIFYEGGPSGFTGEEHDLLDEAFQVWQEVPTSYAAFRVGGIIRDPILAAIETDFRLTVALQVTTGEGESVVPDPADVVVGEVTFPVLGATFIEYTIEDTEIEVAGEAYAISAGTIIDCDIIIDSTSVRLQQGLSEPLVDLKGVMVHEIGHMLGLGHTPLNNLRAEVEQDEFTVEAYARLIETPVFWQTGADGEARNIGVTPTMFPIYFEVETESGERADGATDLAPDDISGVSFLYPRGSQSKFFDIRHEARSYTRAGTGLPSVPLPGGHVVAWADVDNDSTTPRVPVFSTMTGLYELATNLQLQGWFELRGLWKQFEVPGMTDVFFTPTYTLTLNPLNYTGFERQAPPVATPEEFDSIQGPDSFGTVTRPADAYVNAYPSEVFHEADNIIDISNKDAGTPLVWEFSRNTVVSDDTERTLPTILKRNAPMFGDPNDVCPLNVTSTQIVEPDTDDEDTGDTEDDEDTGDDEDDGDTEDDDGDTGDDEDTDDTEDEEKAGVFAALTGGGGSNMSGPNRLRAFRDGVLLRSAAGTALVDLYYRTAPVLARFLLNHNLAFRLFQRFANLVYWTMEHLFLIAGFFVAGLGTLWMLRRRRARGAAAGLLVLGVLLWAGAAHAVLAHIETEDMIPGNEIIVGEVTSVEGRIASNKRIYTDVVIEVDDVVQGTLNEGSTFSFTVIGGRANGRVLKVTDIPTFRVGENVWLYLREVPGHGMKIYGGLYGKLNVATSSGGKKYVTASSTPAKRLLKEDAKAMGVQMEEAQEDKESTGEQSGKKDSGKAGIPLEEYKAYIRELAQRQAEQQK